jgi:hypothetical protein
VSEKEFFRHLEMRVCTELSGMRDDTLRGLWCDGFIPDDFSVVDDRCRVTGLVWIAYSRKTQECWRFALLLGNETVVRDQVQWETMMPGENVTGWLSLDFKTKFMKIDPFSSHPDREAHAI